LSGSKVAGGDPDLPDRLRRSGRDPAPLNRLGRWAPSPTPAWR